MWLVYALFSSAFYGVGETIDNFFSNKEFRHPFTLVFYSSLFNLIYVPIYFFFTHPEIPPVHTYILFALLGFVNIGYLYPYYKGLRSDDTSVAISFLAIERIMVPVLAFFIVGEVLEPIQYLGIGVIVISVVLLGLHHNRAKFRMSKGIMYISWAALFLACEAILLKLLFNDGVSVSAAVGGESLVAFIFGMSVIGVTSVRRDVVRSWPIFKKLIGIFLIEELFTFLGLCMEGTAISAASVSIVKGVTMASPFFIVIYAILGERFLPNLFKEDIRRKKIIRKFILFAILIVGIVLVKE
jgi:drug/metabolite transporter (DMT)-like permease